MPDGNTVTRASRAYDTAQIAANRKRMLPPKEGGPDICFPVEEKPLAFLSGNGKPVHIPEHKALVRRDDDGKPQTLGIVGKGYKLVPNAEFLAAVDAAVNSLGLGQCVTSTDSSHGGQFTFKKYEFPEIVEDIPQKVYGDTQVRFSIEARNGYNGITPIGYGCSAIDGFCDNTLVYVSQDFVNKRHTASFEIPSPDFMAAKFQKGLEAFKAQCEVIRLWAGKEISSDQARDLLAALPGMSERRKLRFLARFETEVADRGATLWALASALTYFSSHNSEEFSVRGSGEADNVAKSLRDRQNQVLVWVMSKEFKKLTK